MQKPKPSTQLGEAMPPWMKHDGPPRGCERLTKDCFSWIGGDGQLDCDNILKGRGYEIHSPLTLLIGAILAEHPNTKVSDALRLRQILAIIHARPAPRGDSGKEDDSMLQVIAERYFDRSYANGFRPVPIAPIINEYVDSLSKDHPRLRNVERDSLKKILARKFRKDKDLLLIRVTEGKGWDRWEWLRAITNIVARMNRLGIPARLDTSFLDERNCKSLK